MVGNVALILSYFKKAAKSFDLVLLIIKFKKSKKHFCNQNIKELS
ncbi:Hypothetical protein HP17_01508 [Helicobacter pylori NCTC 11637 = CCUG 17874 = ATCC 43504 = JCM 12093]|nr:Hypothetical protein HP17_01508 [Helicobacter pylori NCTC 11637 = CCUG 17874 = ATCC 43504 = JCM 12093]